jgi:hypothetical protein
MGLSALAEEEEMASKKTPWFPMLRQSPDKAVADAGPVRLGDSAISAQFPPLRARPDASVADAGPVRLGDSAISARFPVR